jgi:hypothetical protein
LVMRHFVVGPVLPEDTRLFRVKEAGWYIFDEDHIALIGPLDSREECEKVIRQPAAA